MSVSDNRKPPPWADEWVRCAFVVALILTLPPCSGVGESAQQGDSGPVSFYLAEVNFTYRDPVTKKQMNETAEGKYGAESLVETKTGQVMHVHDKENKSLGCKEYTNKIPHVPWIALIERGGCTFTDKIKMATQTYNATAVVVYNHDEEGITIMKHKVETHVSIFVSQKTGKKLARLADDGVKVEMTISPGRKETTGGHGSHSSISKTSVLFVSISFIVLMIISLAWLVFYYIQRFRYAHAKERLSEMCGCCEKVGKAGRGPRGRVKQRRQCPSLARGARNTAANVPRRLTSAAKKAIGKIPQKTVKNGDKELDSDFDQCAVCIEGYKPHDVVRTLPCKHVFHKSCVDPWLLDQRSCPMCKLDILRAYGMQVMGSQDSVHQDPEVDNIPPAVDEGEPSIVAEEQVLPDTEVKVLLLPHTCLHLPSDEDFTMVAAGPTSQVESYSPFSPVGNGASTEQLTLISSWQDSEMEALMATHRDVEEGVGDGQHRCTEHSSENDRRDRHLDVGICT
ncbi:RING finger protein 150-like [Babylonia areolata]|uniref:RING finger protein 150-like n=1 Tax=Babylonia areolata TaxID=304850 RepID=UPI003FD300EE